MEVLSRCSGVGYVGDVVEGAQGGSNIYYYHKSRSCVV